MVRCRRASVLGMALTFIFPMWAVLVILLSKVEPRRVASSVVLMWLFLIFTGRSTIVRLLKYLTAVYIYS